MDPDAARRIRVVADQGKALDVRWHVAPLERRRQVLLFVAVRSGDCFAFLEGRTGKLHGGYSFGDIRLGTVTRFLLAAAGHERYRWNHEHEGGPG